VVHSMKKPWTKPALRTFENPDEAAAYSQGKATGGESAKVEELLERMRGSRGEKTYPPELRRLVRK